MDAKAFTALLVGIITAAIALIGYWNTHYLQRRDRRALMYAEAVAAMRTYEQAPYLVRRRADSSGTTRAAIAAQLIDANTRVSSPSVQSGPGMKSQVAWCDRRPSREP